MGQNHCKCADQYLRQTHIPKCSLLDQQLLAEFQIPDKQNFVQSLDGSKMFESEPSHLPARYTDLYMILRNSGKKYNDIFFPPENWLLQNPNSDNKNMQDEGQKYMRLSEIKQKTASGNKKQCKSAIITLFQFVQEKYPSLCQKMKPIYLQKVGFAVCELYICGQKREVIVDDRIPMESIGRKASGWILILEKAFAKALGCYQYLSLFSPAQIFTEITGIPTLIKHESNQFHQQQNLNSNQQITTYQTFRDALTCDQVLYKTKRFYDQQEILGYRDDFEVKSISFSGVISVFKIQNPVKQMVSLRIVQKNCKYFEQKKRNEKYPYLYGEFFQQTEHKIRRIGGGNRVSNNLYVENQFINLNAGLYYLYVRQFQKHQNLNLLTYSKNQLKISEVYDSKAIYGIQFKNLRSEYPLLALNYTELLPSIRASVIVQPHKIAMIFQKNYAKKALKLRKDTLCLEVEGEERKRAGKIHSISQMLGKWVIIYNFSEDSHLEIGEQLQLIDL